LKFAYKKKIAGLENAAHKSATELTDQIDKISALKSKASKTVKQAQHQSKRAIDHKA
jgi:hypothetical protein